MDVKIEEEPKEKENEISVLQTAQSSPCNSAPSTSIVLDSESTDGRQDSPTSVKTLSSLSRDGSTKVHTLAVAIEAHSKYIIDPFVYAFDNLVEQKVVVIVCLSQLRDEMGLVRCVNVDSFAGVNKKKLEDAVKTQIINVNHFLRPFRNKLDQKGVPLEIQVSSGPKSLDILVQAAKALHPRWLVLDRSFSSQKKKIQAALECNLVLMHKEGTPPEILQVSPVDIREGGEERELIPYPWTIPKTPSSSPKAGRMAKLKSLLRIQNSMQETKSNSNVIPGSTDGGRIVDEDGPRRDQTVLYAEVAPGSRSAHPGKEGHNRSMAERVPILLSSRSIRASPTVSPTPSSSWLSFRSSSTTKRNKSGSLESEIDFSTSSSGSGTSMAESQENASFGMTPTSMVEYATIGDGEHVGKQGDDVPSPPTPVPSEGPGIWSDDDILSERG